MFTSILAIALFVAAVALFCLVFRLRGLSRYGLFAVVVMLGALSMLTAHIVVL